MKIINELEKLGLEIPDDLKESITKKFGEDVITYFEHEKKIKKVEEERDTYKQNYDDAKALLDGFEGKDFDAITKERDDWKKQAEESEQKFKEEILKRDYSDAVEKAVEGLKFTSNSAKKAFVSELLSDPLKMKDGKLLGFDDYVKSYKESDKDAFVSEEDGERFQFTQQMGGSDNEIIKGDPNKMDFNTYKKWRNQNS